MEIPKPTPLLFYFVRVLHQLCSHFRYGAKTVWLGSNSRGDEAGAEAVPKQAGELMS